ncbi:uncharacterized protein LOC120358496 [Solenopsis invicta]|uniref:uncharacterized protein LOC120358496 n=1 Tax=Solenopsis invicta TaxID=13686 RepID=UPI00193E1FE3|nr:uncharacterized protein LOC120358496 [Solenopsis invicta]
MSIAVFIDLQIRANVFTSIYIILVYSYSMAVNSINIFEFYIFVRCLKMKFGLVNQLLCDSLSNLSTKERKLGIFEMKDFAKLINVEQQKQILSVGSIFRYRQQIQSRGINISILEKNPVVPQLPSQIEKQLKNNLKNPSGRYNSTMTICQERKYLLQVIK